MSDVINHFPLGLPPRMMTDSELRAFFGLPERSLRTLRADRNFPRKDPVVGRTDRKAVDLYFDRRSGLVNASAIETTPDGEEDWK